ncbi:MAG TPA: hypothetical protein VK168_02815 [Saprospiraceae bacterium]|nr:hypothetical protein [Saprospiraceae bacterium]
MSAFFDKTVLMLVLLLSARNGFSCSCDEIPHIFMQYMRPDHVVVAAEVIEHTNLSYPGKKSDYYYYSLTKLAVIKWYKNRLQTDTLYYANGMRQMCMESLSNYPIGSQLVMKAVVSSFKPEEAFKSGFDPQTDQFIQAYTDKTFIEYISCDTSVLEYSAEGVKGNITINLLDKERNRISRIRKWNKRRANRLTLKLDKNPVPFQTMTHRQFDMLMGF